LVGFAGAGFGLLLSPPTRKKVRQRLAHANDDEPCGKWLESWNKDSAALIAKLAEEPELAKRTKLWLKLQRVQHDADPVPIDDFYRHHLRAIRPAVKWKES
jgi:hypothetical protein